MLTRLAGLLVRVLVETSVILLVVALLLLVLAVRTSRRLVATGPDPLERISGPAGTIISLFARARSSRADAVQSRDDDSRQSFEEGP